jgi:glutathione synthase/RimK-type ligase-like ATP-grasp enzyme
MDGWVVCVWWVKVVNFPAIMKPISGVSSLGVLKVEKAEDLERCAFHPHTVFFVRQPFFFY